MITDKTRYKAFRPDIMTRLARENPSLRDQGHDRTWGNGLFGHMIAAEHRLQHGFENASQVPGVAKVMEDVRELDLNILHILNENGLPSVSLPPSAVAMMENGKLVELNDQIFKRYLEIGLVPVSFGGRLPLTGKGRSVSVQGTRSWRLWHPISDPSASCSVPTSTVCSPPTLAVIEREPARRGGPQHPRRAPKNATLYRCDRKHLWKVGMHA